LQFLFNNGDQHISRDGAPDLRLHGVLAVTQKMFDAQMLLNPFEEQFNLPTAFVQCRNGRCWQPSIVRQEHQRLTGICIFETNPAQIFRIFFRFINPVQTNGLVTNYSHVFVNWRRINTPEIHVTFGTSYKKRSSLMHVVESFKIQVTSIHDVESTGLYRQEIQHVHFMHFPIADMDKCGYRPSQIKQRMQFDCSFGLAKRSPIKQRQTQVNRCGIQCINTGVKIHSHRRISVQLSGSYNQSLSQRMIDSPVTLIECIRQGGSCRNILQSHVKQLRPIGSQANFNVPQRLTPGQLRKCHDSKQIGTTQRLHSSVTGMPTDDATKIFPWHKFHNLRKQRFAHVHA